MDMLDWDLRGYQEFVQIWFEETAIKKNGTFANW